MPTFGPTIDVNHHRWLGSVYSELSRRQTDHLMALTEWVGLPSVSTTGLGIQQAADYLAGVMTRCGLTSQVLPTSGHPIVLGQRIVDPQLPTILVYGHYDVQPVEPLNEWHSDPFVAQVRNGRVFGRGTADNKGQHLAQLLAIRTVIDVVGDVPINIKVLVEGEEEITSPNLAGFVRDHRSALAADFVYTSDAGLHRSGRPVIALGCRGMLYVELQVQTSKSDHHSGSWGGVQPNPVWALTSALNSIRSPDGQILLAGFERTISRPSDIDLERIALLAEADASANISAGNLPLTEFHLRTQLKPNINISGISAGYSGPGMKTIIPGTATAKLDFRLVPGQEPTEVFAGLQEHLAKHAPTVVATIIGQTPPSRSAATPALIDAVAGAVHTGFGQKPLIVPSLAGTVPDYVFTQILDRPSLIVPYGNADQANHAPNENLLLANYYGGMRAFAAVLATMAHPTH